MEKPVYLQVVQGIRHEAVATYLNAADLLLLTSEHEGMPNSVKEALACNLPVVSTDVGDVARYLADVTPSAVHDDDEALAEAVVEILSSGERSNGRSQVEDIRLERTVERLKGVYEDAMR
jgi:glycosyltransferase involved in cell wall biosynthesis